MKGRVSRLEKAGLEETKGRLARPERQDSGPARHEWKNGRQVNEGAKGRIRKA